MSEFSKNNFLTYYDMAAEAHRALRGDADVEIDGVSEEVKHTPHCATSVITILNEKGAAAMGRPQGKYITLGAMDSLSGETVRTELIDTFAEALMSLLPPMSDAPILLCGIGNPEISSDSLGEKTIARSLPTRHLFMEKDPSCRGFSSTALLTPNVLGNTGIETAEVIRSVSKSIGARAVIIIDALSTAAFERLGTSFQLTDTGIVPGGGIGNTRPAINEETLGIPVIAIGVPTVIYPQAIIAEVFEKLKEQMGREERTAAPQLWDTAENTLVDLMNDKVEMYAVTPKDIDCVIDNLATILTAGIHIALHPKINIDNFRDYLTQDYCGITSR